MSISNSAALAKSYWVPPVTIQSPCLKEEIWTVDRISGLARVWTSPLATVTRVASPSFTSATSGKSSSSSLKTELSSVGPVLILAVFQYSSRKLGMGSMP